LLSAILVSAVAPAGQADSAPSMAGESSKIRPAGERQIGAQKRPTIQKKAAEQAQKRRGTRVNLQIPERLRDLLAKKIERRIGRNVAESKKLRREALALLTKFVAEADAKSNEMPEALLRIGELEWEDARDRFVTEFRVWESRPADLRGDPPLPSYAKPRQRLFRVLSEYKGFREYDLALYVDGCLANEEGKLEEARGRFDKIVEWFPKSRFIPDAHMARAEYEFAKDRPDYQRAYLEYEEVLKFKDSELYDLALFKSAWTLWRLGKPDEAARRFLSVFKATAESRGSRRSKDELDELQSEALRNLVAVFVEDERNRAEDMHRFLTRAGGDKFAGEIVSALAEAFYDQAHYERGVEAYRLLLKLEPTSPEAYRYALRIAQAHSTMEAWPLLEQDYRWILKEYVPPAAGSKAAKTSAWIAAQPPNVAAAAEREVEKQLREDAVGLHAKAQADENSRAEFEAAVGLYEVYLGRFDQRKEAYEIYFNLAEIEFYRLENATRAADAYLACVRIDPSAKLSRTALYNALSALEVSRAAEFEAARKAGKKQEETPTDKKLTEAMELYVKSYPSDAQIPELLFRQGKLYYDYQVYDPAVRQWGLLLEKYPNSKYALGAGELILDSFNKSRDYVNIETWARRLKTAPTFQSSEQQSRLNALIVGAVFKQGEQLSAAGEQAKAAAAYLRAAKEFPKEERAAQAAVNAEVAARRAGDLATLAAAADLLVKEHGKRPEAAQGVWIAATTHQEVGLFREAAGYHDRVAQNWPRFEQHREAAFNATLLWTTVGDHDKAIRSGERYKQYYPRDEAADEVTFLMGKAHEKANKKREAALLYDRYAKSARSPSSQIEALVRLAAVSDDDRARSNALERAVHVYTGRKSTLDDRGKYYAARARYMQGEAYLARFDAVKIEGDVKQLKDRLKKKSELLKKAADAFLSTAEMGVAEWTTGALYQIGFTYESFSKALLASPPPSSLGEEDKELYRQSIEEFVIPIEERSLEAYESGWQKAVELNIYNAWTAKMREALGRLNAELYPPLKEIGVELRSRGPTPLPGLIEAPRRGRDGRSRSFLITSTEEKRGEGAASNAPPVKKAEGGAP
jgi:outer membrane protein assembly factor BamD (BamD/ComL family)